MSTNAELNSAFETFKEQHTAEIQGLHNDIQGIQTTLQEFKDSMGEFKDSMSVMMECLSIAVFGKTHVDIFQDDHLDQKSKLGAMEEQDDVEIGWQSPPIFDFYPHDYDDANSIPKKPSETVECSKDAVEIITCTNFLPFIDMVTPENPIDVVNGRFFLSSYFLFSVYAHEMCFYDLQHQDKLIQGCLLLILSHLKTRGRVFSN